MFRREVDGCAQAGPALAGKLEPVESLLAWLERFTSFVAAKQGLGAALHCGDPAYDALPGYFLQNLGPTLAGLLARSADAGLIRDDIDAETLLLSVNRLCTPGPTGHDPARTSQVVPLLIDGLRFGASPSV